MRLPDFYIIGAMKCATSSLHDQLARRDAFFLSDPKEPNFFNDDALYPHGLSDYSRLFAGARRDQLVGESSTHSTKLPTYGSVAQRIKRHTPDARFVYVMRSPVQRLVSQFIHEWSERQVFGSIDQAVLLHERYVAYSSYARQLAPFVECFGAERILPVFFERLVAHPVTELERVARFLGDTGEQPFEWIEEEGHKNVSRERMRRSVVRDAVVGFGPTRAIKDALSDSTRERIKAFWRMGKRPRLSPEVESMLERELDRDLRDLGQWLQLDLSCRSFKGVAAQHSPTLSAAPRLEGRHPPLRVAWLVPSPAPAPICHLAAALCQQGHECVLIEVEDVPAPLCPSRDWTALQQGPLSPYVPPLTKTSLVWPTSPGSGVAALELDELPDADWLVPVGERLSALAQGLPARVGRLLHLEGVAPSGSAGRETGLVFRVRGQAPVVVPVAAAWPFRALRPPARPSRGERRRVGVVGASSAELIALLDHLEAAHVGDELALTVVLPPARTWASSLRASWAVRRGMAPTTRARWPASWWPRALARDERMLRGRAQRARVELTCIASDDVVAWVEQCAHVQGWVLESEADSFGLLRAALAGCSAPVQSWSSQHSAPAPRGLALRDALVRLDRELEVGSAEASGQGGTWCDSGRALTRVLQLLGDAEASARASHAGPGEVSSTEVRR